MRTSLELDFKDPRYSLILNLLITHFSEFSYKKINLLMFIVWEYCNGREASPKKVVEYGFHRKLNKMQIGTSDRADLS